MLNNLDIDQAVRLAILNLCVVLHDCGITEVHVGGIMRILGVPDSLAQEHDNERILLDKEFLKYVDQINEPIPPGQVLH